MSHTVSPEVNRMPSTYKQSFKQNYTDNVELVHLQLRPAKL